uniref:(northern house mosquito) hypothetical protein n=1 Tax=Culex pipiens TaxID=7175 RepID=A0A8D8JS42_CULPI
MKISCRTFWDRTVALRAGRPKVTSSKNRPLARTRAAARPRRRATSGCRRCCRSCRSTWSTAPSSPSRSCGRSRKSNQSPLRARPLTNASDTRWTTRNCLRNAPRETILHRRRRIRRIVEGGTLAT